jgi:hypothetical protein
MAIFLSAHTLTVASGRGAIAILYLRASTPISDFTRVLPKGDDDGSLKKPRQLSTSPGSFHGDYRRAMKRLLMEVLCEDAVDD